MIEQLISSGNKGQTYFPDSGPGRKTLLKGTEQIGYFGTLTATELFDGWEVSSFLGLTAGTINKETGNIWMKYIYHGKFLFVCKDLLRTSVTWNDLYKVGAIYGAKGNGLYPVSGFSTDQFRVMLKEEAGYPVPWKLAVRVLKGALADPYVGVDYTAMGLVADGIEYNDLIYRLLTLNANSRPNTAVFEQFPGTELGTTAPGGGYTALQETSQDNINNSHARSPTGSSLSSVKATGQVAWRPVFELINNDAVFAPYRVYQEYTGNAGPLSVTGTFVDVVESPFQFRVTDEADIKGPSIQSATFVDVVFGPNNLTVANPLYPVAMTFTRT